jgi:hypothetical protein
MKRQTSGPHRRTSVARAPLKHPEWRFEKDLASGYGRKQKAMQKLTRPTVDEPQTRRAVRVVASTEVVCIYAGFPPP